MVVIMIIYRFNKVPLRARNNRNNNSQARLGKCFPTLILSTEWHNGVSLVRESKAITL